MTSLRRAVVIVLVGAAWPLAACGDDEGDAPKTVDAAKLEQEIAKNLSAPTREVTSVSCPDDAENETDTTFTCHAKLGGMGSAEVAVKVQEPNDFTYSFKRGTAVLAGAAVEKELEEDLAANGAPDASVTCPEKIKVEAGATVTCPVKGAGNGAGTVSFEFTDAAGSIDDDSVQADG